MKTKMAASLLTFRYLPVKHLCGVQSSEVLSKMFPVIVKRHNSNSTSVTRPRRSCYTRTYPTMLVFPDGSTVHIRYKEPRKIVKLPLDFSQLSEAERRIVLANRKPKEKLEEEVVYEDTFDANEYTKYWKK